MGRIIRRTVTITITETWTIVWTTDEAQADDTVPPQATTVVQDQPKPQEEPDEAILPALTPGVATNTQLTDVSPSQAQAVNANVPATAGPKVMSEVSFNQFNQIGKLLIVKIKERYQSCL